MGGKPRSPTDVTGIQDDVGTEHKLHPSIVVLHVNEVRRNALDGPPPVVDVAPGSEPRVVSAPEWRGGSAGSQGRKPAPQFVQGVDAGFGVFDAHMDMQAREITFGGYPLAEGSDGAVPVPGAHDGRGVGDQRGSAKCPTWYPKLRVAWAKAAR